MKRWMKEAVGRCVLLVAAKLPRTRQILRPIGLRTSQGLFGHRTVSLPFGPHRPLLLRYVDESYLSFQLFWRGVQYYEPITRALLEQLTAPGSLFLDVGAHLGFFSLTQGLATPGLRIIAFEPNPKNFRILLANAAMNGLSNLVCEPIAISDKDGTGTLYLTESDMSASLMKDFQAEDTQQTSSIEVRTASLDAYLRKHEIRGPMVIKVDIEGHEPAFFRGAANTITAFKPDIILEVLYDQDPALVAWLKSLGYRFYPISDKGLVEMDSPRLVKRFPFLFLNHLLSARPRTEVAAIFDRLSATIQKIDLKATSKHFPKEEWPALWRTESAAGENAPRNQGPQVPGSVRAACGRRDSSAPN